MDRVLNTLIHIADHYWYMKNVYPEHYQRWEEAEQQLDDYLTGLFVERVRQAGGIK